MHRRLYTTAVLRRTAGIATRVVQPTLGRPLLAVPIADADGRPSAVRVVDGALWPAASRRVQLHAIQQFEGV